MDALKHDIIEAIFLNDFFLIFFFFKKCQFQTNLNHSLQRQKDLWTSFQIWESRFSEVLSILGSYKNETGATK